MGKYRNHNSFIFPWFLHFFFYFFHCVFYLFCCSLRSPKVLITPYMRCQRASYLRAKSFWHAQWWQWFDTIKRLISPSNILLISSSNTTLAVGQILYWRHVCVGSVEHDVRISASYGRVSVCPILPDRYKKKKKKKQSRYIVLNSFFFRMRNWCAQRSVSIR